MSLGYIGVKSVCGATTTQITIKDLFEDMSNELNNKLLISFILAIYNLLNIKYKILLCKII